MSGQGREWYVMVQDIVLVHGLHQGGHVALALLISAHFGRINIVESREKKQNPAII